MREKSHIRFNVLVKYWVIINEQCYNRWSNYFLLFLPLNKVRKVLFLWLKCSFDIDVKFLPCRHNIFVYVARIFFLPNKNISKRFLCVHNSKVCMLIAPAHLITTLLLGGLVLGYHLVAFFRGKSLSFCLKKLFKGYFISFILSFKNLK